MKATNLKWIAIVLSALLLFQSCKVYHNNTSTVDEVVLSQNRVLVKYNHINKIYKFERIERENDILYGITTRNSPTAKKLFKQVVEENMNGKYVKIMLPEKNVKEYRLQDKTKSTILTVLTITISAMISVGVLVVVITDWFVSSVREAEWE